jgi:hypothetical protein
VDIIGT